MPDERRVHLVKSPSRTIPYRAVDCWYYAPESGPPQPVAGNSPASSPLAESLGSRKKRSHPGWTPALPGTRAVHLSWQRSSSSDDSAPYLRPVSDCPWPPRDSKSLLRPALPGLG